MINGIGYVVSALTVYVIVSVIKPFIEAWLVPQAAQLHDPVIRLLAFLVGAVTSVSIALVYTSRHDGPSLFTAAVVGLGAALTAIGTFHVTNTNFFDLSGGGNPITTIPPGTPVAVPVQQSAPAVVVAPMPTPPSLPDSPAVAVT